MWDEADKRGLAGGEKGQGKFGGYGSAEGTREVVRFMVSRLGDEYSAYLGPAEVKHVKQKQGRKARGLLRRWIGVLDDR